MVKIIYSALAITILVLLVYGAINLLSPTESMLRSFQYSYIEQGNLLKAFNPITAGLTILVGLMISVSGRSKQEHLIEIAGTTIIIIGLLMLPLFLFILFSYHPPM